MLIFRGPRGAGKTTLLLTLLGADYGRHPFDDWRFYGLGMPDRLRLPSLLNVLRRPKVAEDLINASIFVDDMENVALSPLMAQRLLQIVERSGQGRRLFIAVSTSLLVENIDRPLREAADGVMECEYHGESVWASALMKNGIPTTMCVEDVGKVWEWASVAHRWNWRRSIGKVKR